MKSESKPEDEDDDVETEILKTAVPGLRSPVYGLWPTATMYVRALHSLVTHL
jgi:hypothetical protein